MAVQGKDGISAGPLAPEDSDSLATLHPCAYLPNLGNDSWLTDLEGSDAPPPPEDRQTGMHTQTRLHEASCTTSWSSTAAPCSSSSRATCSRPVPVAQCRATLPTCQEGEETCETLAGFPSVTFQPGQLVCRVKRFGCLW